MKKPSLLCIGHRGAMGYAPENTLSSVQKALSLGVLCIEVDVYYVDKHLVIFHDYRLERTTDGEGYLAACSFEYLRTLDAGDGQKIPTIDEVSELIRSKACLNIELKGSRTAEPVAEYILEKLEDGWDLESFLISSFHKDELVIIKQLIPSIKIGVLINGKPRGDSKFAEDLGAFSVHPSSGFVTKAFVDDAHNRCMRVFVYGVDDSTAVTRMYRLGADGVFTGYPKIILAHYAQGEVNTRWCDR